MVAMGIQNKNGDVCALGKFPIYLGFQIAMGITLHLQGPEKGICSPQRLRDVLEGWELRKLGVDKVRPQKWIWGISGNHRGRMEPTRA